MKLARKLRKYCPHCNKHTEVKVKLNKNRKKNSLNRVERRRSERINKGYGGNPYPLPQNSHRHRRKATKKTDIRLECSECSKTIVYKNNFRIKKVEMV